MGENQKDQKLSFVDLVGIKHLLNHLVTTQILTPEERDKVAWHILKANGFSEMEISLVGMSYSWNTNSKSQDSFDKKRRGAPTHSSNYS